MRILSVLLSMAIAAVPMLARATFVPENEIQPRVLNNKASQITEAQFNDVIRVIQTTYGPTVSALGGRLAINGSWKSDRLNAGATQMFGSWKVVISGAIARQPELTPDGLALIICHEVGHHLGGFAFAEASSPMAGTWAANEGQADYFSTQVCARRLWSADLQRNADFRASADDTVKLKCDAAWTTTDAQNLCYRIGAAVKSMTNTMAAILNRPAPQFATPDEHVVTQTFHGHPAVQCRMDTALQGALCVTQFRENLIPGKSSPGGRFGLAAEKEAADNSCIPATHVLGSRPACWFKGRL